MRNAKLGNHLIAAIVLASHSEIRWRDIETEHKLEKIIELCSHEGDN